MTVEIQRPATENERWLARISRRVNRWTKAQLIYHPLISGLSLLAAVGISSYAASGLFEYASENVTNYLATSVPTRVRITGPSPTPDLGPTPITRVAEVGYLGNSNPKKELDIKLSGQPYPSPSPSPKAEILRSTSARFKAGFRP